MARVPEARRDGFQRALGRLFESGAATGLSEAELLERFAHRGDESAFEALVERHGPMVLGVCRRRLRDPNDVDDAFQAVFLILFRKAGSIRRKEQLGAWLHGVALKVALRAQSLALVREAKTRSVEPRRSSNPDPAEAVGRAEESARLHEEVQRLPGRYRSAVVACYFEGRTHEEAAELLGCPLGTVKGRLARARDLLRKRLERQGVAVSPAVLADRLASPALRPTVPPSLVSSTIQSTLMTAESLPISIRVLVEGALRAMILAQAKAVVVPLSLVAAGLLVVGGSVGAYSGDDKKPEPKDKPPARVEPEKKAQKKADGDEPEYIRNDEFPMMPKMVPGAGMGNSPDVTGEAGRLGRGRLGHGMTPPEMGRMQKLEPSMMPGPDMMMGGGMMGVVRQGRAPMSRDEAMKTRQDIARISAMVAKYEENPATKATLEALDKPFSLRMTEKSTLDDLLKRIKGDLTTTDDKKVPVYVDPQGLEEAGASFDSPVVIDLEGVPLKLSLRLALKQVDLAYCVRGGVVIISSLDGVLQELKEAESELIATHPGQTVIGPDGPVFYPSGGGGFQ